MHINNFFLAIIVCLAVLAGTVWPEDQASKTEKQLPETTTIQSTTRAVVLDVVVRDEQDHAVSGLSAGDFQLVEDGQVQSIASFEENRGAHVSAEAAQVVILIDEMNTAFLDLAYVRYCLRKLLTANGGRLQQPNELLALTNDGLILLHPATNDGSVLMKVIQKRRPQIRWRQTGGLNGELERIEISLQALHEIAASGVGSKVRRNLVWISPGFPIASKLTLSNKLQARITESIHQLSAELLRARVTVYTVDPRGVQLQFGRLETLEEGFGWDFGGAGSDNGLALQDMALQRFTVETGGRSFWGRNDIDSVVAKSIEDGSKYYTLLYYPSNRNFDGSFRTISVTTNRTGLVPRTRAGYFALPEPELTTEQINHQLLTAVLNPLHYLGLPLQTSANQSATDRSRVRITVEIKRDDVGWINSADGKFRLVAETATYMDPSAPADLRFHEFQRSERNDVSKKITLNMSVPITAQAKRIRLVVCDPVTGKLGSSEMVLPGNR